MHTSIRNLFVFNGFINFEFEQFEKEQSTSLEQNSFIALLVPFYWNEQIWHPWLVRFWQMHTLFEKLKSIYALWLKIGQNWEVSWCSDSERQWCAYFHLITKEMDKDRHVQGKEAIFGYCSYFRILSMTSLKPPRIWSNKDKSFFFSSPFLSSLFPSLFVLSTLWDLNTR